MFILAWNPLLIGRGWNTPGTISCTKSIPCSVWRWFLPDFCDGCVSVCPLQIRRPGLLWLAEHQRQRARRERGGRCGLGSRKGLAHRPAAGRRPQQPARQSRYAAANLAANANSRANWHTETKWFQTGGISTGLQQLLYFGDDKSQFGKKQRQKKGRLH